MLNFNGENVTLHNVFKFEYDIDYDACVFESARCQFKRVNDVLLKNTSESLVKFSFRRFWIRTAITNQSVEWSSYMDNIPTQNFRESPS